MSAEAHQLSKDAHEESTRASEHADPAGHQAHALQASKAAALLGWRAKDEEDPNKRKILYQQAAEQHGQALSRHIRSSYAADTGHKLAHEEQHQAAHLLAASKHHAAQRRYLQEIEKINTGIRPGMNPQHYDKLPWEKQLSLLNSRLKEVFGDSI